MSIVLPDFPGPSSAVPRYLDFGSSYKGGQGGATQRFDRPGNRFALDVEMPPIRLEPRVHWGVGYRVFLQRLRIAKREGAIYPFPQQGFVLAAAGVPVVDGDVAANTAVMSLAGFSPGSILREGQFVSIIHEGRRYIHSFAEERVAAADGTLADASMDPIFRVPFADGDIVELIPMIEGSVQGEEVAWPTLPSGQSVIKFMMEEDE
jgi:hypothetical protein